MNFGGKCGRLFLIAINLTFFLLGLGLLIIGILLKVNIKAINKDAVVKTLNEVNLGGSLHLGILAQSLPILLICTGIFVLIVAGLGMFGACFQKKCMLVTYAIIVFLIVVLQIVIVVLFSKMKSKWEDTVKGKMQAALNAKYKGPSSTDEVSTGWDLLFIGMSCCGAEDTPNRFNNTPWWSFRGADKVPYSCCKSATENNYKTRKDNACTEQEDPSVANKQGCYQAVKNYIVKYKNASIGFGIGLLVIEIIGVVSAFVFCREIKED